MQTVQKISLILPTLDMTELRQLNNLVIGHINNQIAIKQRLAMNMLRVGSIAEFRSSKTGKMVRVLIDKLNQKTVSATEVSIYDGSPTNNKWRVAASFLKVVS